MLSEAFHAVQSSRGRQLLAATPFVFVNIQLSMLLVLLASEWNIRLPRFLGKPISVGTSETDGTKTVLARNRVWGCGRTGSLIGVRLSATIA
jgi:hypothetical protein